MPEFEISLQNAEGDPLGGVPARVHISASSNPLVARTDARGTAKWSVTKGGSHARLEIGPIPGHWSIAEGWNMQAESSRQFRAQRLPPAQNSVGWWHRAVGVTSKPEALGRGIKHFHQRDTSLAESI